MKCKDWPVLINLKCLVLWLVLLGCLVRLQASMAAEPSFTEQLVGTWATADSLFAGTEAQAELHLTADGFGIMAGSTPAPVRSDGVGDEKLAPRGIVGYSLQAQMDGVRIKLQILQPQGKRLMPVAGLAMFCSYQPSPATLNCLLPSGRGLMLPRRSVSVSLEAALQIDQLRQSLQAPNCWEIWGVVVFKINLLWRTYSGLIKKVIPSHNSCWSVYLRVL